MPTAQVPVLSGDSAHRESARSSVKSSKRIIEISPTFAAPTATNTASLELPRSPSYAPSPLQRSCPNDHAPSFRIANCLNHSTESNARSLLSRPQHTGDHPCRKCSRSYLCNLRSSGLDLHPTQQHQ